MTFFHWRLLFQSAGGPFLDGWLLSIIGVALIGMTPALGLSGTDLSLAGTAALIGIFFGGLVFGRMTDIIGRQLMYTIDLIVLVVGSVLCAFVDHAWQIILLRFLIGVAIGADYPIATSLLAEWLPTKQRAAMLGSLVVAWFLGATVATFLGFGMVEYLGEDSWRWMLASSGVPGLIILLMRIGTPESPRWLLSKGRFEEAEAVVRKIYGQDADLSSIREAESVRPKRLGYSALLQGGYLKRTFFCGMFYLCAVTPVFAIYTFGPVMLSAFGLNEGNLSNIGYALISLLFLLGCLPALRLSETVGRRPLLLWSFALMILPFLALGIAPEAPVALIIFWFCLYAVTSGGPNILEWSYPNELFPTDIRATAMGVITAVSRIGAALGTFLLPLSLEHYGDGATMLIMAAMTAVGFVVSYFLAPETKGRSLSEASGV
ncbi:metabolite transporter [Pseudomonas sp. UME83]|nr:metabolite transporter [Pseudomonas sp. UMC76]MBB1641195.1 metabolite transporter [Pseudomonas sp. UME83]NTX92066.1 sugar porter family MFS transporter [Pseudomonas sp. UMA643]NTY21917.1 sugar porter family MFS transporter [Pseudomonas sp. UMC3103]NTY26509.1 sugar porter family MFS transporter [Pseudomonas sp. UMA603]NTY33136.1 sugar porter family MFS transporter [Pseudomonas sp. UMC3129]NTY54515.1 sugar porter family MFS transporter [Pseudomonas sp. UMC631]NTY65185.1 sugar porter family 